MRRTWMACSGVGKAIALAAHSFSPGLAAGAFFGPDLWLLYHLLMPSAQGLGPVYTRFATGRKEVWLTIDDGPDDSDTPLILDLLDRHRSKATFFLIGKKARGRSNLVREIANRGHGIGHHTDRHPCLDFWAASPRRVRAELDDGFAALAPAGARPRFFRPPVGIKNLFLPGVLAERGLVCVGWTVRALDCRGGDPARVAGRVLRRVRPGSIVLMHEGSAVPEPIRVNAIARVLEGLADRGYSTVLPDPGQLRTPGGEEPK